MAKERRPSNTELIDKFKAVLTTGFVIDPKIAAHYGIDIKEDHDHMLEMTKAWRGEMWRQFNTIAERLDPWLETQRIRKENAAKKRGKNA